MTFASINEDPKIKIHLLSDVHTEFADIIHTAPSETDVVVLAGDIGNGVGGLNWAKKTFPDKPVVYVAGNHEYYLGDIGDVDILRERAAETGILFLERDAAIIGGVRFLGCTLWSDIQRWSKDKVECAKQLMNDYCYIRAKQWWGSEQNRHMAAKYAREEIELLNEQEMFEPVVSYLLHNQSIFWLTQQLRQPFSGKTVIVTHHAPSYKSTVNEMSKKRQTLKHSYASDLETIISEFTNTIDLWVHGHIHYAVNYTIQGVPVRSNPRGYPVFNPMGAEAPFGYDANLLIDI